MELRCIFYMKVALHWLQLSIGVRIFELFQIVQIVQIVRLIVRTIFKLFIVRTIQFSLFIATSIQQNFNQMFLFCC